ncbi:hypothetical protein E4O93_23820, partial [Diaphorobacter sp. DS2]
MVFSLAMVAGRSVGRRWAGAGDLSYPNGQCRPAGRTPTPEGPAMPLPTLRALAAPLLTACALALAACDKK